MKRNFKLSLLPCICLILLLAACGHEHVWRDATCTDPAICEECGETKGDPLGHTWVEATCTDPKTCSVCGETEGEALGHDWQPATHESPETCSRCGETRGDVLLYEAPAGLTNGYEFGEFDKFNSFASENGLGGTMVWINGTFENVSSFDLSEVQASLVAYITVVTDEDGHDWLVELDLNEYGPIDKYESLEGHQLCILGQYDGFSEVYETPVIILEKIFDRTTGDTIISTWYTEI